MVNENEKRVIEKYEKEGWKTLRGGAPDFLFLKVNNGKIEDFIFVEVKTPNSELTYEQEIYRKVLEKLGAKYEVEVVQAHQPTPSHPTPRQPTPDQPKPIPKEVRNRERDES